MDENNEIVNNHDTPIKLLLPLRQTPTPESRERSSLQISGLCPEKPKIFSRSSVVNRLSGPRTSDLQKLAQQGYRRESNKSNLADLEFSEYLKENVIQDQGRKSPSPKIRELKSQEVPQQRGSEMLLLQK